MPLILVGPTPSASAVWIGPGGGAITDLIFDTADPNTVFAAASSAGVYKSTDGGLSWRDVSQGLAGLDITALEVAPKNNLLLYAGTYKGRVYKSADNGESWYESGSGIQPEAITYAIEVDPKTSSRLYLATRGQSNNGEAPWSGVVYKSVNGGGTWTAVLSNVGGSSQQDWAYDLAIHPLDTNALYAATHEHGAYRSLDYGATWAAANSGVTDLTGRTIEPAPNTAYPGTVYLGVFHQTGLFKSLNGGTNWSLYDQDLSGVRIYKLSIDPNNPSILYLATFDDGVMRSTNAGVNWSHAGMDGEIILDVVVHPGNSNILLSGTLDNGLWRSTNSGATWVHSQAGLNASSVSSIVVQQGDSQALFASLSPGWVARSSDGGATWSDFHTGIADKYVTALVSHPTETLVLYALSESAGLYIRHTTLSPSWVPVGEDLPLASAIPLGNKFPVDPAQMIWDDLFPGALTGPGQVKEASQYTPLLAMVFAPASPLTAYLGTAGAGVYKSIDDGATWSASGLAGLTVRCLAVKPDNPLVVFAGTDGSGSVRRTINGGSTWTSLNLPTGTAYALAIPDTDPSVLYVATDSGIYKYNGSWSTSGLEGRYVTTLAIHPSNANLLYAGTTSGAFVSTNGGLSWEPGPDELEGIWVRSIRIDPNNPDIVYFTTYNHSVLRLSP
jgi:photosystem II stability/assembly factor-like uncharacterized protein